MKVASLKTLQMLGPLLTTFSELQGHYDVPNGYQVTAELLAAARLSSSDCRIGFRLDLSLLRIQTTGGYDIDARPDRQAVLEAIGCDWTGERQLNLVL